MNLAVSGYIAGVELEGDEKTPAVSFSYIKPTPDEIRDRPQCSEYYRLTWLLERLRTWNYRTPSGEQSITPGYEAFKQTPRHLIERIEAIVCGGRSDPRPVTEPADEKPKSFSQYEASAIARDAASEIASIDSEIARLETRKQFLASVRRLANFVTDETTV